MSADRDAATQRTKPLSHVPLGAGCMHYVTAVCAQHKCVTALQRASRDNKHGCSMLPADKNGMMRRAAQPEEAFNCPAVCWTEALKNWWHSG